MKYEITIALIGTGSALLGAIVGGFSTYFTNKSLQKNEWENSIKKDEINEKKKLYSAFITEANRLILLAFDSKTNKLSEFEKTGNYLAEMQFISSKEVILSAEKIADYVLSQHTIEESKKEHPIAKLRREFYDNVRNELQKITKA